MLIRFVNFYWHFIQGFSRIAALLTLLLKVTILSDSALKAFRADNNEIVEVGGRANRTVINLSKNKKFRNSTCVPNIGAIEELNFLNPNAKKGF